MLDGAARVDDLVAAAVADGQPALGITDHGNMYGVLDFYGACREAGGQPGHRDRGLHGRRVPPRAPGAPGQGRRHRRRRRGRPEALLPPDPAGRDQRRLPEPAQALVGRLPRGLLLQAPGRLGAARALPRGPHRHHRAAWAAWSSRPCSPATWPGAETRAARLQDIFGRGQPLRRAPGPRPRPSSARPTPSWSRSPDASGRRCSPPTTATTAHRTTPSAHDALLCVQTGTLVSDPKRFKFESDRALPEVAPPRCATSSQSCPRRATTRCSIAERANVEIEFGKPQAARVPGPGRVHRRHLRGAGQRLPAPPELPGRRGALRRPRCPTRWWSGSTTSSASSSRHGLLGLLPGRLGPHPPRPRRRRSGSGPGRGSAAGCCVAYCLRIVDLDPIRYDLLFERFLNPGRKQMPDIDMDFDERYRGDMIRYAAERYGSDHVAQIVTFSTIKARAAVRDAARVLGLPLHRRRQDRQGHAAARHGPGHPAAACLEPSPSTRTATRRPPSCARCTRPTPTPQQVIDVAKGLEGLRRQDGIHAAAVVITNDPLTEYLPVQRKPEPGSDPSTAAHRHPVRDARRRGARPAEDGLPRAAQPLGHRAHAST